MLILLISYSRFYVLLNEIKPTGILTKIPYTLHRTVKINAYDFDVHWRFSSVCQTPKYYYFSIINSAVKNLGRSIQNYLSTNFTPRKWIITDTKWLGRHQIPVTRPRSQAVVTISILVIIKWLIIDQSLQNLSFFKLMRIWRNKSTLI